MFRKLLIKHGDGSWYYIGSGRILRIERNWQPIAGMAHKWNYSVRDSLTNEKITSGHGNTLEGICDVTKSYFGLGGVR